MLDIKDKVPTLESIKAVYDELNNTKAKKENSIFYIVGNSTTVGTWTGDSDDITEYYDGLAILYKVNIDGNPEETTLNINSLGASPVVCNDVTRYPIGSIVMLIYTIDVDAGHWVPVYGA